MTYFFVGVALLCIAEKAWKHLLVICFFRQARATAAAEPRLVSILQPILSGDPTLPFCLEQNLRLSCHYPREFIWLVDQTDLVGQAICRALMAAFPQQTVRLLLLPPPLDGCSPKMVKLLVGIPQAAGDVLCVLDDDTMLPPEGLEECLPYLDQPGVGLAFGLPYYVSFDRFWSRLVAYFVNSHSLLTYVPYTYLIAPITINGMFYVFKRAVYEQSGGFAGLETILADDFAVARRFSCPWVSPRPDAPAPRDQHPCGGAGCYFRLLHRWFIFPRETLMKALPWHERALAYSLALATTLTTRAELARPWSCAMPGSAAWSPFTSPTITRSSRISMSPICAAPHPGAGRGW